jgi:cysteine synthase A
MTEALEQDGKIEPYRIVAEFTLGHSGIALTGVHAGKGYRLILKMLVFMLAQWLKILVLLGARIDLEPPLGRMNRDIGRADVISAELGDAIIPQQFTNSANPRFDHKTTAKQIWRYTDGDLDGKIAGVGTCGASTGCTRFLANTSLIDEVILIANETAFRTVRNVVRIKSIPASIFSGIAIAAPLVISERPDRANKRIVIAIPTFAEYCLSKLLFKGN